MCFPESELGSPVPWKNSVPSSFFLCHAPAVILQSLLLGAGDEGCLPSQMSISEACCCPLPGDPGRPRQDGTCLTNTFYFLSLLPIPLPVVPGVTAKCKVAVSGSATLGLKTRGSSHYFVTHVNLKSQLG